MTVSRPTPCNVDPRTGQPFDVTALIHTFTKKGVPVTATPTVQGDIPPEIDHGVPGQMLAMNNQWASVTGCNPGHRGGDCYEYITASAAFTETALMQQGTVADNYHSANPVPSWTGHTDFATAGQTQGFTGQLPTYSSITHLGARWACNGNDDAQWRSPTGVTSYQPSCYTSSLPGIPGYQGAYRPSAVQPDIPTLFQDLDAAGVTWRIYGAASPGVGSYQFAICPSFASCIYTAEGNNLKPDSQYFVDAANGTLPQVSFFLPGQDDAGNYSQHNLDSWQVGENMTARVINAMQGGPQHAGAVFMKTWDDCGCFYTGELDRTVGQKIINGRPVGLRIPAVFEGAYVRLGWTDSTPADTTSVDALIEWLFNAPPISPTTPDGTAYDFHRVFDFTLPPPSAPHWLPERKVPAATYRQLKANPDNPDDPT
jgi:hypothetical protein